MPDAAPVPIAQSYDGDGGTGSVTFSEPLNTSIPLDPADWRYGNGGAYRQVTAIEYDGAYTVSITAMDPFTLGGTPAGWRYQQGTNPLEGTGGLEVASFSGFTG